MIDRDGIQLSDRPCSCGWRHQVNAFEVGARVRIVDEREQVRGTSYVGRLGRVSMWSCYTGRVMVRVQVDPATDEERAPDFDVWLLRCNYRPCELEHV